MLFYVNMSCHRSKARRRHRQVFSNVLCAALLIVGPAHAQSSSLLFRFRDVMSCEVQKGSEERFM